MEILQCSDILNQRAIQLDHPQIVHSRQWRYVACIGPLEAQCLDFLQLGQWRNVSYRGVTKQHLPEIPQLSKDRNIADLGMKQSETFQAFQTCQIGDVADGRVTKIQIDKALRVVVTLRVTLHYRSHHAERDGYFEHAACLVS